MNFLKLLQQVGFEFTTGSSQNENFVVNNKLGCISENLDKNTPTLSNKLSPTRLRLENLTNVLTLYYITNEFCH